MSAVRPAAVQHSTSRHRVRISDADAGSLRLAVEHSDRVVLAGDEKAPVPEQAVEVRIVSCRRSIQVPAKSKVSRRCRCC